MTHWGCLVAVRSLIQTEKFGYRTAMISYCTAVPISSETGIASEMNWSASSECLPFISIRHRSHRIARCFMGLCPSRHKSNRRTYKRHYYIFIPITGGVRKNVSLLKMRNVSFHPCSPSMVTLHSSRNNEKECKQEICFVKADLFLTIILPKQQWE